MDSHFQFIGTATLEKIRQVAEEFSKCAGSFNPAGRAKIFSYASAINNGLDPAKEMYQDVRFKALRFGQGTVPSFTPLDIELASYKCVALEVMAQFYLLEAFGGPQNPIHPGIVQFGQDIEKYPGAEDGKAHFISEVIYPSAVNPEEVKNTPGAKSGIRFNDSLRAMMGVPTMTGSAYREECFAKGKALAREGISFCPTDPLMDAYRFCVRHEHPANFLDRTSASERLVGRDVASVVFFSGELEYAFHLLSESLLLGPPFGDAEVVDFYHYLALGVEGQVFSEGLVQKISNTDSFKYVPEMIAPKVLPEVRTAVASLRASPDVRMGYLADLGEDVLRHYDAMKK